MSSDASSVDLPGTFRVTGTMVNYLGVCERKLWLFSRGLRREQESELVRLGKAIHESSFQREQREVLVLGRIRIDHTTRGERVVIHEVKKSKSFTNASRLQLLFYLYELERLGLECSGELHFRSAKRKMPVSLDEESRAAVEASIREVHRIVQLLEPPDTPKKAPCRRCAYRDYCSG